MNAFDKFSLFSGLKPNKAKCEIADIGARKGISLAVCGMDCIDFYEYIFHIIKNLKLKKTLSDMFGK